MVVYYDVRNVQRFVALVDAAQHFFAAVGGLADGAILLLLTAADAVDVRVGLDQLDIVVVASALGANGGLDVVLTTTVLGVQAVLGAIHGASHLDPTGLSVADKVGGLDEASGEKTGLGSLRHGLGAESNSAVLVGSNVTTVHGGQEKTEVLVVLDGADLTSDLGGLGGLSSLAGSGGRNDGQEQSGDEERL